MYNHVLANDNHKTLSNSSENHHHLRGSCESFSFRHLYHHSSPPGPSNLHDTLDGFLHESDTSCASTTILSPETSPLVLLPHSTESRWSFSSPPCTPSPPVSHQSRPLLYNCTFSLRRLDGNINCLALAGGLVFTATSSPCVRVWQQVDCSEMGHVRASSALNMAILANGNMLFTTHKDHKIRVWTIANDSAARPAATTTNNNNRNDNNSTSCIFLPRKIASLPKQNQWKRFMSSKPCSKKHKDTISCMAYNLADGLLYTGSHDKTVKAWSLTDQKCVDTFAAHADKINAMVINEDGYLFTCSSDGTLKMWSKVCCETFHTLTMTLHLHPYPIYTLALTTASLVEGSFLYAGSSDGCIYFWEQQISGEYVRRGRIEGHQFGVLCLAVVEDMVFSGSADSTIRIWRRKKVDHECFGVLEGHKAPVKCIAACLEENFVRGFHVYSAGLDRTFKAWKVRVLPEANEANHLFGYDIDDEE